MADRQRRREDSGGNSMEPDDDYGPLTRKQLENVADFCDSRIRERMYAEIGRSLVKKIIFSLGAASAFLAAWASDLIRLGPK